MNTTKFSMPVFFAAIAAGLLAATALPSFAQDQRQQNPEPQANPGPAANPMAGLRPTVVSGVGNTQMAAQINMMVNAQPLINQWAALPGFVPVVTIQSVTQTAGQWTVMALISGQLDTAVYK